MIKLIVNDVGTTKSPLRPYAALLADALVKMPVEMPFELSPSDHHGTVARPFRPWLELALYV